MSKLSWDKVTPLTISNCFKHAGFIMKQIESNTAESTADSDFFVENIYSAVECQVSFSDYVSIDDNLAICGEMSDEDIIKEVIQDPDDSDSVDDGSEQTIISTSDAWQSIILLRNHFESQDNVCESIFKSLNTLDDYVIKKKICGSKQSNLHNYFHKI